MSRANRSWATILSPASCEIEEVSIINVANGSRSSSVDLKIREADVEDDDTVHMKVAMRALKTALVLTLIR
jgi:hypothetical protein